MNDIAYDFVVSPLPDEDGGGYIAYVPDLFGCVADGETPEEAITDLRSAIEAWIAAYKKHEREVPAPGVAREEVEQHDKHIAEVLQKQSELIQDQEELIALLKQRLADMEREQTPMQTYRRWAIAQRGEVGLLDPTESMALAQFGQIKAVKFST